ncbi:MAG: tetratricopeptide repeat protein [Deltaproteobacteria bacterium]|nr:tetratricopeptide repeat protein [Deltaproteobacteria bacterium]
MFTRLWNLEALVVMLGGLAVVVGLALDSDLGWVTWLLAAGWLAISIPLAMSAQATMIPIYVRWGRFQRALDLAVAIRESAPSPKIRHIAGIDVAMVQIAMGRFERALENLESARVGSFKEGTRALVVANRAYCRAHLGQDLEQALEEAESALSMLPEEGILDYVRGLCLHKLGRNEEAREAIARSLERDPTADLPVPAERPWIYSRVLAALDEGEAAAHQVALARKRMKHSPFREAIEAA